MLSANSSSRRAPFAHIPRPDHPRHSHPWLRTKTGACLPRNSHVFPSERPVLSVGCLSQGLFFSLLFLLLFFLGESPLEVLDNAFLFLLFRSIALSLLTEGTRSLRWLRQNTSSSPGAEPGSSMRRGTATGPGVPGRSSSSTGLTVRERRHHLLTSYMPLSVHLTVCEL